MREKTLDATGIFVERSDSPLALAAARLERAEEQLREACDALEAGTLRDMESREMAKLMPMHWPQQKRIYLTNLLVHLNREVKRRSDVEGISSGGRAATAASNPGQPLSLLR